jgi:hypothetical protein
MPLVSKVLGLWFTYYILSEDAWHPWSRIGRQQKAAYFSYPFSKFDLKLAGFLDFWPRNPYKLLVAGCRIT